MFPREEINDYRACNGAFFHLNIGSLTIDPHKRATEDGDIYYTLDVRFGGIESPYYTIGEFSSEKDLINAFQNIEALLMFIQEEHKAREEANA